MLRLEADGTLVVHGDLNPLATFYGNDMVVDSTGRAYVGNFGFDLDRFIEERGQVALVEPPGPPATVLIRVDPDGTVHEAAADLSLPQRDGHHPGRAHPDRGRDTGRPAHRLRHRGRWLAQRAAGVGGTPVVRARRDLPRCRRKGVGGQRHHVGVPLGGGGGEIVSRVSTSQNCFACMLGGEDGRTLYLVTAPTSTESVVSVTRSGRLEQARVAVGRAGRP